MNPINVINQEFARMVVEEWNSEASIRRQERQAIEAPVGTGSIVQVLVAWVRERISQLHHFKRSKPVA